MARSIRNSPIFPMTSTTSEKDDKRLAARRERVRVTALLSAHQASDYDFDLSDFNWHPRSGQWLFGKDGKYYGGIKLDEHDMKRMRK